MECSAGKKRRKCGVKNSFDEKITGRYFVERISSQSQCKCKEQYIVLDRDMEKKEKRERGIERVGEESIFGNNQNKIIKYTITILMNPADV